METEDQIRKNWRGGHSTALQLAHPFQRREVDETTFGIITLHMYLRLHEIVEAGDSGISFDTCLADEASSFDKESERSWSLQAAEIVIKLLASLALFLLDADFWPACKAHDQ